MSLPDQAPATEGSSPSSPTIRRRWRWLWWGAIVGVLLLIADGSRRTPADFTRPLVLRKPSREVPHSSNGNSSRLRLATFNIHGGKGTDGRLDLERTARLLEEQDFVGLNEATSVLWPRSLPDQPACLGERLGMTSIFVPTERRWWHDHFGNGLLTRLPLKQILRVPLPGTRGKAYRCATMVQIEIDQRTINLISVHIDSQSDRIPQLRMVLDLFLSLEAPAILMGDLNSTRSDPDLRRVLSHPDVVDVLQGKTDADHIDWILGRGIRCDSARLVETDASDHPALVAEVMLDGP